MELGGDPYYNSCYMQASRTDDVTDAVLSASTALVAVAARSLSAVAEDVTLPQFRALVVLSSRTAPSMSALADALDCSPSTATRLCDRLVRKGLVARNHSESNRREVEVDLTDDGRRLVDQVRKGRRLEIARIVAEVPVAQRQPMVAALRAFAAAAGEPVEPAWTSGWNL